MTNIKISAIVPTIGRPQSLKELLNSLAGQSRIPDEVIVADASAGHAIANLIAEPSWEACNLMVQYIRVSPANAVRQRRCAITASNGDLLLFLDDDVVLESQCLERLSELLCQNPEAVAVSADFNNQSWSPPTHAWRFYLRVFHNIRGGDWQGRVLGPLLRFGYYPSPTEPVSMEWVGTGNSLIRRDAYESVGGFSDFFLYRCTMNEDIDLGIKLRRVGTILLCPAARLGHFHDPIGRVSPALAAEDDIYNRFMVLYRTLQYSKTRTMFMIVLFILIESLSNMMGTLKHTNLGMVMELFWGRLKGLLRLGWYCIRQ